ncbi:MAG: hypothetical protein M1817_005977 [Caeruleum heppii]|nr:MAG: hypothetical protein M1817_005977 [Caeruleum heppii]
MPARRGTKNQANHGSGQSSKKSSALKVTSASRQPKTVPAAPKESSKANPPATTSAELQQRLLDIFSTALNARLTPSLPSLLQEIKGHLFARDFEKAFGKAEYLDIYALRWSPGRALAYLDIFQSLSEHILRIRIDGNSVEDAGQEQNAAEPRSGDDEALGTASSSLRVTCLGGGAGAEVIALSGFLSHLNDGQSSTELPSTARLFQDLDLTTVDLADWSDVLDNLKTHIVEPPRLSVYASAARKAAATPLLAASSLSCSLGTRDILSLSAVELRAIVRGAQLITLMFTLNELYTSSVAGTTKFLMTLGAVASPGTLLLVVDSPGTYSTVAMGGREEKKYPMQWLLDRTLLEQKERNEDDGRSWRWEKLVTEESKWFRIPEGLRYPIELENMRYQMHLYRLL